MFYKDECWGIIPARGGSKSVRLKNMHPLGGHPLIDYVIFAGQASSTLSRIICSTEHHAIADHCRKRGIRIHKRPEELAGDQINVVDVLVHLLEEIGREEGCLPYYMALLQPTSPFLLPEHIEMCVKSLKENKRANSSQTIWRIPHCFHAFNQRIINDRGYVRFKYEKIRKYQCWNKQSKPDFFAFATLVVTKTKAFLKNKDVFSNPSVPHLIEFPYGMDVDRPDDFIVAEALLAGEKLSLPHMIKSRAWLCSPVWEAR